MNIRALAASTLAPVIAGRGSLSSTLEQSQAKTPAQERKLFMELCLGSLRQYHRLNAIAKQLMRSPLKSKDADIHALIILGLYQLRSLRIPDHAAIDQSVDAARSLNKAWSTKLVNGVLRNFLRKKQQLEADLAASPEFQYAHPQWLLEQFRQAWPESWPNIIEANNQQAPLSLRVNRRHIQPEQLEKIFRERGIHCEPLSFSSIGLRLENAGDISQLPGYDQGAFSVQDEAAQLSAQLLSLAPGMRVLDACCAPGGKASHLAEAEPELAELVGVDIDAARLATTKANFERLGIEATLLQADVADTEQWWNGKTFARILLDAPCSATGVIRRHPDIKLLRRKSDLKPLRELQRQLIRKLWPCLQPGGVLLYATCSVLPRENEAVVGEFVEQTPDAVHDPIDANWGSARPYGRQLLPQVNGHDGFYYARIMKAREPS